VYARFGSGGRGSGGWYGKSVGGQFAKRSPPRSQYEGGRSCSFEMERRNGPQSSFRGFHPPPAREVGSLLVVTWWCLWR
jgi:hypothetical protein